MKKPVSRTFSFVFVALVYLLALAAAIAAYRLLGGVQPIVRMFLADAAATLVVWLAGVAVSNSSVYDPYWSVAPIAIAAFWAMESGPLGVPALLCLAVVFVWGTRLTANWARRWQGLGHQDWRYTMYRRNMPRLWFIINLFGINLMPTVLVFLGMISVYYALFSSQQAILVAIPGFLLAVAAILLEHIADRQMDAYQRRPNPKSPCIAEGLWLVCRHPNYLGEVLFWWGLWAIGMSAGSSLWTVAGPTAITALFVFVSIPMMEKHITSTRPEYEAVIKGVPVLLPSPGKLFGSKDNEKSVGIQ